MVLEDTADRVADIAEPVTDPVGGFASGPLDVIPVLDPQPTPGAHSGPSQDPDRSGGCPVRRWWYPRGRRSPRPFRWLRHLRPAQAAEVRDLDWRMTMLFRARPASLERPKPADLRLEGLCSSHDWLLYSRTEPLSRLPKAGL